MYITFILFIIDIFLEIVKSGSGSRFLILKDIIEYSQKDNAEGGLVPPFRIISFSGYRFPSAFPRYVSWRFRPARR